MNTGFNSFKLVYKHYESKSRLIKYKFIFVGECSSKILNILKNISKERKIKEGDEDEIVEYFNYQNTLKKEWGNLDRYNDLFFIPFFILGEESVDNLIKIITKKINLKLKKVVEINEKNLLIYNNFIDNVGYKIQNLKKKILKIYLKDPKNNINKIINKIFNTNYDELDIKNFNDLDTFLKNKYQFQILNFFLYKTIKSEYKIEINPLIKNIIINEDDIDFTKIELDDNLTKQNNNSLIIDNFGLTHDNTYFVYNIQNVKKFFKLNENFNKIFNSGSKNKLKNSINNDDYFNIINNYLSFKKKKNLVENNLIRNHIFINIRHYIILPKDIELKDIFNNIILSKNIPFVKFKDKSEQIVHKFFKPVFQRKQKKYRTIINKNELYNWIKYSSIKFDNNEVIYKTNMTKVLLYKLLFFELKGKRKLKGKLYSFDLNDNKFEIESKNKMIYVVEKDYIHNFNKISNKLKPEMNIEFYDKIDIYGDIEIDEIKNIHIKIDLKKIKKRYNLSELINIIKIRFNYFINILMDITLLNKFKKHIIKYNLISDNFENRLYYVQTYIKNYINNITYEYKHKQINYRFLEHIADYMFPFIKSTLQPIYGEGDKGHFIIDNKELRTNVIIQDNIGSKGYILDYDVIKNKYRVKLNNDEIKSYSRNILQLENNIYNSNYELIYKKIKGYKSLTPLKSLLLLLKQKDSDDNIDTKILGIDTGIDIDSLSQSIKKNDTLGISININYLNQTKSGDNLKLPIYIKYINSVKNYDNIFNFLCFYFDTYYNCSEKTKKCPPTFNSIIENKNNLIKSNNDNEDSNEIEDIDDDFGDEFDDDEFDNNWDITNLENNWEDSNLNEYKNTDNTPNLDDSIKNDQEITSKKTDNIWAKLKKKDPDLFEMPKNYKYPRLCQGSKQPVIISNKMKKIIDEKYKTNLPYQIDKKTIDCYDESSAENATTPDPITKKEKGCHAILWGSNEDKKNWYICPKLYDSNLEKPLNIEDLEFPNEKFISKTKDAGETEKEIKEIMKNWDKDKKNKNLLSYKPINVNPNKGPIYISKPAKGEGSNHSFYPGFLTRKHTNIKGQMVPCCHTFKNRNIKEAFLTKKNDSNKSGYILGVKTVGELDNKRMGLLPEKLHKAFNTESGVLVDEQSISKNNTYNICNTGNGLIKNCYLRRGIQKNKNSFFNLIAYYLTTDVDIYRASDIINLIITNLTYKTFKELNNGDLFLKFNTIGETTSFQNFLEYTISNENKEYEYYYELLTKPNSVFFKKGITLILLEYEPETENIKILCPYFCNYKFNNDPNIPLHMAIKIKGESIFEPIIYCKDKNFCIKNLNNLFLEKDVRKSKYFNKKGIYLHIIQNFVKCTLPQYNSEYNEYFALLNEKKLFIKISLLEVYEILNKLNFQIEFILKDFYNKIIGIMIEENKKMYIIPLYPQGKNLNCEANKCKLFNKKELTYSNVNLLKIDDITYKKNEYPTLKEYLKIFKIINNETKNPFFPIKYIKDDDNLIGFISNTGIYIPVKKEKYEHGNNYFNNNFIEIDKEIFNYKKNLNKKIYSITNSFEKIKEFKLKIISKNKIKQEKIIRYFIVTEINLNNKNIKIVIEINPPDNKDDYNYNDFSISNIGEYVDACIILNKHTNFKLNFLPINALFSENKNDFENKMYDRIILETGLILNLKSKLSMYEKNKQRKFKITKLLEEPLINKFFSDVKIIEDKIETYDSVEIKKMTYVKNIYKQLLINLGNFFRMFYKIRKLISKICDNYVLNFKEKKELLKPAINVIINIIINVIPFSTNYPDFKIGDSCDKNRIQNICETIKIKKIPELKIKEFKNKVQVELKKKMLVNFKELEEIKEYNKLIILENENKTRIDIFKTKIINDLSLNLFKRKQILKNNFKEISNQMYESNDNEFLFFESDLIKEPDIIENYFNFFQKFYYNKYPLYNNVRYTIDKKDVFLENANNITNNIQKKIDFNLVGDIDIEILDNEPVFKDIKLSDKYTRIKIVLT
jgi:hypothetical protein